tara:strand:- start:399 stop:5579 length:5181 start_codon:yes stop_codon:yes gene_type:complete
MIVTSETPVSLKVEHIFLSSTNKTEINIWENSTNNKYAIFNNMPINIINGIIFKEFNISLQDQYIWVERDSQTAEDMANAHIRSFLLTTTGVLDIKALKNSLSYSSFDFPDVTHKRYFTQSSFNNNEIKSLIQNIAKYNFTHISLTSNVSISPFDVNLDNQNVYSDSNLISHADLLQKGLTSEDFHIFCTDRKSIYRHYTLKTNRSNVNIFNNIFRDDEHGDDLIEKYQKQYTPITNVSGQCSYSRMETFALKTQINIYLTHSLSYMFANMCNSNIIPCICYVNNATKERQYKLHRPSMQTHGWDQSPIVSKTIMSKWISSLRWPPAGGKEKKQEYICIFIQIGQTATKAYENCHIKQIENNIFHVNFDSTSEQGKRMNEDELTQNSLEFLLPKNTNKKDITISQLYLYSHVRKVKKSIIDDSVYCVQYINGPHKNKYALVNKVFLFTEENSEKTYLLDIVNEYAQIFVNYKGLCIIEYECTLPQSVVVPKLQDETFLIKICKSYLQSIDSLQNVELSLTNSNYIDSKYLYRLKKKRNVTLATIKEKITSSYILKEYIQVVPIILLSKGDTIRFRNKRTTKMGIIIQQQLQTLQYLVKVDDKQYTVNIENIIYESVNNLIRIVPIHKTNMNQLKQIWITWCFLAKIPHKDIPDTLRFIGDIDQALLNRMHQTYRNSIDLKDFSTFRKLYTIPTIFVDIEIENQEILFNFHNVHEISYREKLMRMFMFINDEIETDRTQHLLKKSQPSTFESTTTVLPELGILNFDDSDDSDDSDSDDSDDSDSDTNNGKGIYDETHDDIIFPDKTLIEKIQRLDSYFIGKKNFKEGYARSCQKSSSNQPLVLQKYEFDKVKSDFLSSFDKYIKSKYPTWKSYKPEICTQNTNKVIAKKTSDTGVTCAAVEFHGNIYICPNTSELLKTVQEVIPENIQKELITQQNKSQVFIGLNSVKAPCCFLKRNKNLANYISSNIQTSENINQIFYSPYIKEWGHHLDNFRIGFCPPECYNVLGMKTCPLGNITRDSNHNCLLRLGIDQNPDTLFYIMKFVYAIHKKKSLLNIHDFKIKLCKILLALPKDHEILKNISTTFITDSLSPLQNFIEYILSQQLKTMSLCEGLVHLLFEKSVSVMFLNFHNKQISIDCLSSTGYSSEADSCCIIFQYVDEKHITKMDLLIQAESLKFSPKKMNSIKVLFNEDDHVQGQNLYQIVLDQYQKCYNKNNRMIHSEKKDNINFPTVQEYVNIFKKYNFHMNTDSLVFIADIYGKVIGFELKFQGKKIQLPTYPSHQVIENIANNSTNISISNYKGTSLIDTIEGLRKIAFECNLPNLNPQHVIKDSNTFVAIEFSNGQIIRVQDIQTTEVSDAILNVDIRHHSDFNVDAIIEKSKIEYLKMRTRFEELHEWDFILDLLSAVDQRKYEILSLYKINEQTQLIELNEINLETNTIRKFGIHVVRFNNEDDNEYVIRDKEPSFDEHTLIHVLMDLWRYSNSQLRCRPYRYVMNKKGMYTHILLENGHKILLKTPIKCYETIDNIFRSERLTHNELFHHTTLMMDMNKHMDTIPSIKEQHTLESEFIEYIGERKKALTEDIQQKISTIVHSSNIQNSKIYQLNQLGFSERLSRKLLNDDRFLWDYIQQPACSEATVYVPNYDITKKIQLDAFYSVMNKQYFLDLLSYDSIPIYEITKIRDFNYNSTEYDYNWIKKEVDLPESFPLGRWIPLPLSQGTYDYILQNG